MIMIWITCFILFFLYKKCLMLSCYRRFTIVIFLKLPTLWFLTLQKINKKKGVKRKALKKNPNIHLIKSNTKFVSLFPNTYKNISVKVYFCIKPTTKRKATNFHLPEMMIANDKHQHLDVTTKRYAEFTSFTPKKGIESKHKALEFAPLTHSNAA